MNNQQPMAGSAAPPDHTQVHDPSHPYAFLVHSQSTLDQNLPPKIDNKVLARQKRRRTSPEDHAILESEYQKNSKPDKAARAEIVKKVALGEKAVQIWFQNRRQNDRRKSRPLLPHELIPHLRNPPPHFQTPYAHSDGVSPAHAGPSITYHQLLSSSSPTMTSPVLHSPVEERAPSRGSSIHDLLNPSDEVQKTQTEAAPSSRSTTPLSSPSNLTYSQEANASTQTTSQESHILQSTSLKVVDPPSNSRKRTFDDVENRENVSPLISTPTSFISSQERSSSIRLSMSLDGAVKVKTTDEDTPSPPKQRSVTIDPGVTRARLFQRSRSEVTAGPVSIQEGTNQPRAFNGTFGRSRDARTWEFFCDSDARDALAAQAERERNGSAVGAISLIRSQSKKSKENLRAQQRRDALQQKPSAGNIQRQSLGLGSKPKLSRAQSSMGRLQHPEDKNITMKPAPSKADRPSHTRSTSGDSDKENWAPGTRASQNPLRRTLPPSTDSFRPVLQDHPHASSYSKGLAGALASDRKRARTAKRGLNIAEDEDKENFNSKFDSNEIAAFMKANGSTAVEKEDDLDCIQGLLSLSQGAWR